MSYTLGQEQLDGIENVLQQDLIDIGVSCVFLIDMAGNIIANRDNGESQHDVYSLAALAAGNFVSSCPLKVIEPALALRS
ncbi:MAG: hypothetical protein AB1Z20_18400, partial [Desulfobacterales bacterium]